MPFNLRAVCRHDFSLTSGTLFAWHKLPLRSYLLAVAVFCNEVKGKSMLALARDLDVQYKTAFVLAHKLREAMAASVRGLRIGGEGRVAEIDGAYFGGHVRPENLAADRVDRRLSENKSGKRRAVVVETFVRQAASETHHETGLSGSEKNTAESRLTARNATRRCRTPAGQDLSIRSNLI